MVYLNVQNIRESNIMFLKLLISSSLAIITASVFAIENQIITLSPETTYEQILCVLPKQYDIILTSYVKKDSSDLFVGKYNISIQISESIQRIQFYIDVNRVIDVTVFNTQLIGAKISVFKPVRSLYDDEKVITEYIFPNDLLPGNYVIKLVCNITDISLKKYYNKNEQWLAAYVDSIKIRYMVPRLPQSLLVSPTYNIIIEHYQNCTVLSNIPIQKMEINDKNMMMTHFNTTLVKINYFLFLTNLFLMGGRNENLKVDMWCRMHCAFAHEIAENITSYLIHKFEISYTTWEINHVAIPDYQNEIIGLSNQILGLVLYREIDIIYNENVDSVVSKIKVARWIAHNVVQNCIYYKNSIWSLSFWLNEAIVLFLESYIINQVLPNTRTIDLFVVQVQHESLHFDAEYDISLYNTSLSNNSFESPRHIRASCVLRMLQHMITEEIFWEGIRIYVEDINYSPDYFGEIMKKLLFSQTFASNLVAIKKLINSWTQQKYYPILKVTRDYNHSNEKINISIQNLNKLNKTDYNTYYVPITYTTQMNHNFNHTFNNILLRNLWPIELSLNFKEDGWILFNVQQTGYYRVNYDIENWNRIADYLSSEDHTKIHVLNRAQIIDDAFHLMITYQLNSTIFWNITGYLTRETDYVAWYPMFKALEYLSNIFLLPGRFDNIKHHLQIVFRDLLLYNLKYDEVSNEDDFRKSLRMEAAKWACSLDEYICKEKAGRNLKRHLANPQENTLLPWWKEWTYCQGLKELSDPLSNTNSSWWRVYYLGKEKFKTKFLKYLACPEDSHFIRNYINLIATNSTTAIMFSKDFSDRDYVNYFLFTIAKRARDFEVLDLILHNFENIKPKQVSEYAAFTIIINHVYSVRHLTKISDFLMDKFINATKVQLNEYEKLWLHEEYRVYVTEEHVETKIRELNRINEEFRYTKQNISNIQSKIKTRLFEIERQRDYFWNFTKSRRSA